MITFSFDGYELHEASAKDFDLAQVWTAADSDHAGRVLPEFWITDSWLLSDAAGPVFFFRGVRLPARVLEIHVQFANCPLGCSHDYRVQFRERLAGALVAGMAWLERNAHDIDELRFDSTNGGLIHFCEKRLGFTDRDGRLSKRLIGG